MTFSMQSVKSYVATGVVVGSLIATSTSVWAQEKADTLSNVAEIEKMLGMIVPGAKVDSIKPVDVKELYEVTFGADIAYVSKDGRYMMMGDLIDVSAKENLTENQRGVMRGQLVSKMDEAGLIVFGPENPKHTITVFTDIDCGYCRKMHAEMDQYEKAGIAIRYAAFPRAGIGSESYDKAVSAWCAKDRKEALTQSKAGVTLPKAAADCVHPVDEQYHLTRTLRFEGTPTLVLKDGTVIPGYVPADRLRAILDERFGG